MAFRFYVDACIYLNLWQKEGDTSKGVPYWLLAKDFFNKFDDSETIIYYSGFLLRELEFVLTKNLFIRKKSCFMSTPTFKRLYLSDDELNYARKIESDLVYGVSFYDIIHMLLAKKANAVLVTRDNKLLEAARLYGIMAGKPEEFL